MFSFCQIYIIIICVCHPLLFLKFLRCHTKLFLKQFDKIRGRVYSDDIAHLSCAVMPFGYQLGSLFQSYQTDKVRRRCSGECLNLTMQARPTHVDNLRQAFHTEIRIGDILFNDTYDFIYQLFIRFAQSYRLRSDIRFLDKRFLLPLSVFKK